MFRPRLGMSVLKYIISAHTNMLDHSDHCDHSMTKVIKVIKVITADRPSILPTLDNTKALALTTSAEVCQDMIGGSREGV